MSDYIPHHRTVYFGYDDFCKDKADYCLPESLPSSANGIRYYSGVRHFVSCAGYSMILSETEYNDYLDMSVERYRKNVNKKVKNEENYTYDENRSPRFLDEDFILRYDMGEIKELIGKDDVIQDYRIIGLYRYYGGPVNYYSIIVASDKTHRVSELSVIDRRIR